MIAIKKYLFQMAVILFMSMPTICLAGFEIQKNQATETVGGTIPVIQKVFVSEERYSDLFSSIDIQDFSRGFKETNTGKVVLTVLANAPWKVSAKAEFKPVGGYLKPASDLLIKIKDKTVIEEGWGSGGTFNKNFVSFGSLSNEDQVLWMNDKGGDHCRARIDYKMLLSPMRDIPGEYSVMVTYTISAP